MAIDFSDLQEQRFASDLQQAASYKPLLKEDLNKAYKRYAGVGVKMGRVKGKTDAQLYKMATDDVLRWYKKTKAEQAAAAAAAKRSAAAAKQQAQKAAAAQGPVRLTGSGGGYSSGGARSSGGSSSTLLPNTAMAPLSQSYIDQQIERNGLQGSVVPSYALKSRDAFDAWVRRAVEWKRLHSGQAVAVKTPTGTKVTTSQPVATNRNPVIR